MKTITQTRTYLALVAMFVTLGLAGPVAAQVTCPAALNGVPFHGTLHGTETNIVTYPTLSVHGSGTGIATQLGKLTVNWLATVNISTDPSPSTGTFQFIAANGDQLVTDFVGVGTGAPLAHITECNTIKGGTGRFAGASGAFTIHRVLDLSTGSSSASFYGAIVIHEAKQ